MKCCGIKKPGLITLAFVFFGRRGQTKAQVEWPGLIYAGNAETNFF